MDLKEHSIRQYMSSIDFKNDDWKTSKMLEDMRKFLGEEPSIEVVYKKDVMITEVTGIAKEFVDVDKIQIVFTGTDNKFHRIEFIIGEKI